MLILCQKKKTCRFLKFGNKWALCFCYSLKTNKESLTTSTKQLISRIVRNSSIDFKAHPLHILCHCCRFFHLWSFGAVSSLNSHCPLMWKSCVNTLPCHLRCVGVGGEASRWQQSQAAPALE